MKILFLNHNIQGRGTYFRCMGFARELAKQGHRIDLWTVSPKFNFRGTREEIDGVRIWITPRWGTLGKHDGGYAPVDNFTRLLGTMGKTWDIVHAFDHRPNVLLPWMSLRVQLRSLGLDKKTRFFMDWCDWWAGGGITTSRRPFAWIDRIEQQIEEGSKRIADGVTVISSVLQERALQAGVSPERLLLLPSGTNGDHFPLLERRDCRRRLGLPLEKPLFGFVGFSLWDLELLADAFERILQQQPDAMLLVIGGGVEEQAKDIFRERFVTGSQVVLPGVVPFREIPVYLGACDIQLLPMNDTPANRARVPNKLYDYWASGRPCAASEIGESARLIQRHETGVAEGTDAQSLANAGLRILRNPGLGEAFGRNARHLAENQYACTTLSCSLLKFYDLQQ